MKASGFWLAKHGNSLEEYEDALAIDAIHGRFAIADGATTTSYSDEWAQILTQGNIIAPVRWQRKWADWLPPLQREWWNIASGRSKSWYSQSKLQEGAAATLVSLVIDPLSSSRWWSTAVGDSCLFHVRNGVLITSFPMKHSSEFGVVSDCVGTLMPASFVTGKLERWCCGKCESGDQFYLATDALAKCLLCETESGRSPWEMLLHHTIRSQEEFAGWIEQLRNNDKIDNDDVTLGIIEV